MISPVLEESMLKRAIKSGLINVKIYDLRDHSHNKHKKIDSRPYGGGPGMVLGAEPILRAHKEAKGRKKKTLTILLTPNGKQFNNKYAKDLSRKYKDIIIICGHYEGIDARVEKILKPVKLSIGPFILTGGELAALAIVDSTSRYLPGVLGNENSLEETRYATDQVYTRPEKLKWKDKNYKVPDVLLTGHHKNIEEWHKKQNEKRNKES